MKLSPDATNASSSLNEVASSAVHPNMLPPKVQRPTSRPEFPSLRLITKSSRPAAALDSIRLAADTNVNRAAGLTATAAGKRGDTRNAGEKSREVCYHYAY